ncbi:MAG: hypothetical protein O9346_15695 [Leptospiraceae bacterium]|nr:hypothetical protein [Leptospiraceae bacterium]MCZ8347856.1 hypothetical protein [Leptospiraceae bacterium]
MEILALISINMAFAFGMYLFFSAKMTRTLKESQGAQLEKKIRSFYAQFIHQSDQSITLLDSKLGGLRDLIQRAENLRANLREDSDIGSGISLQLQNLINHSKHILNESQAENDNNKELVKPIPIPYPYMEQAPNKFALGVANVYTQNEPISNSKLSSQFKNPYPSSTSSTNVISKSSVISNKPSGINKPRLQDDDEQITKKIDTSDIFASIGKRVKNIVIGSTFDEKESIFENRPISNMKSNSNTNSVAYLIDGDPFADQESAGIRNLDEEKIKEEGSFLSTLSQIEEIKNPKPKDRIDISPESVLKELPDSATKIDKVVFLLTKGYSHEEVADVMNLGYREVLLIETVKMDKSRRK